MGWEQHRGRKIKAKGDYEAWIGATAVPDKNGPNRPSGHAWEIHESGNDKIADEDVFTSDSAISSHNRGYLTAAYRIIEALREGSRLNIISTSDYVVRGINEWLPRWRTNGWQTADKRPIENIEVWQAFDALLKQRLLEVAAERPKPNDIRSKKIIGDLQEKARGACEGRLKS